MKKLYKLILCTFMCVSVIFTCSAVISAASKVATVKGVKASSVSASTITLKWKKALGVSGYRIYKYSSKKDKYVYLADTKKTTYKDSSLTAGKAYKYKVRAYKIKNKKRTYGAYSDAVKAVTEPAKVTGVKTTYLGATNVKLSWKKAKGASGYEVFIYDSKKKAYISKGTVTKNGCTLKKLTSNTKYKVRIAAYHKKDGKVYGTKSSAFTFRTALPDVGSLRLTASDTSSFTIKWSSVKGADGYQVYRYVDSTGKWKKVKTTSATSYTLKKLEPGTSYVYKVRAYKENDSKKNYGGFSSQVTAGSLPKVPTGLAAATDNKVIRLSWKANGKATGYEVSRYNAAKGKWEVIGKTSDITYTDDTLTETSSYTYKIRAYVGKENIFYTDYTPSVTLFFESNYVAPSPYSAALSASGLVGFLYDAKENCFYTAADPWQRRVGYNESFDVGASLVTIYIDTVRIKYEYADKDWMLQLWKGQYGLLFYGAEVGLYNKPKDRSVEHYDCAADEEMLKMSMELYNGGVKKFSRPYGSYWWCTGFVPLTPFTNFMTHDARENLRLDTRITMKDYDMLTAVRRALDSEEVIKEGVIYSINGLNLYISYQ
ncbi:MAG: DUF4474 domain-containing protein [Ruminococcaceae bacterium]|nr:DUF4474 domain-containing protein [Oscillospiraceae bacterium]